MQSIGITIIVIILVPVLFQVILQSIKQTRRHQELLDILHRIERTLEKKSE